MQVVTGPYMAQSPESHQIKIEFQQGIAPFGAVIGAEVHGMYVAIALRIVKGALFDLRRH